MLIISNLDAGAVATVLTVYGIETRTSRREDNITIIKFKVATVLTVYGIETLRPLRPRPSR